LGTQVRILSASAGSGGRIEVEYYTAADLDRLYSIIMSGQETDRLNAVSASSGL
jgi:hypothetical protein